MNEEKTEKKLTAKETFELMTKVLSEMSEEYGMSEEEMLKMIEQGAMDEKKYKENHEDN